MKIGKLIDVLQEIKAEYGDDCIIEVQGDNPELGYVFGGPANTVQVVIDTGYLAGPTAVRITAVSEETLVVHPQIKDFVAFLD